MPNLQIDYDASVPGVDTVQKAPVHVKVNRQGEPLPPGDRNIPSPGGQAIPDFVPSSAHRDQIFEAPPRPEVRGPHSRGVVVEPEDYLSPEDSKKRAEQRKQKILDKAKEIYRSYKDRIVQYNKAKKLVENASEEELEDPGKKLAMAIRIVDYGVPMTKKKAIEEAKRLVLGPRIG